MHISTRTPPAVPSAWCLLVAHEVNRPTAVRLRTRHHSRLPPPKICIVHWHTQPAGITQHGLRQGALLGRWSAHTCHLTVVYRGPHQLVVHPTDGASDAAGDGRQCLRCDILHGGGSDRPDQRIAEVALREGWLHPAPDVDQEGEVCHGIRREPTRDARAPPHEVGEHYHLSVSSQPSTCNIIIYQ
jgi:hypothetical protein